MLIKPACPYHCYQRIGRLCTLTRAATSLSSDADAVKDTFYGGSSVNSARLLRGSHSGYSDCSPCLSARGLGGGVTRMTSKRQTHCGEMQTL